LTAWRVAVVATATTPCESQHPRTF
jgi:hypothetical protein